MGARAAALGLAVATEKDMDAQTIASRRIGAVEVISLWDGPLATSFDKIPDAGHREEAQRLVAQAGPDALTMNVYAFLLKHEGANALIDAGAGPFMGVELGRLRRRLNEAGLKPQDITRIFMTHVHRDHYGGLTDAEGVAVFPNAELVLHEVEAAYWLDTPEANLPERAQRNLPGARQALAAYSGRLHRMKEGETLGPLRAQLAPGHTPGHTSWVVESNGQSLIAWGDLTHLAPVHLPAPHIAMEYDLDPRTALHSRLRLLDRVAETDVMIAGAHLPAPGLGFIKRSNGAYRFEPSS
jgi:glyoxylase-like metal-dependent hydrolase (beta-lactamase superfamily II)